LYIAVISGTLPASFLFERTKGYILARESIPMPDPEKTPAEVSGFIALVNPIVLISLLILFSVFVLIGAAVIGFDKGVLSGMAKIDSPED